MREKYEKDELNFLPSESEELHPTFKVDDKPFTLAAYDKRTPGLFKVETKKYHQQTCQSVCCIYFRHIQLKYELIYVACMFSKYSHIKQT